MLRIGESTTGFVGVIFASEISLWNKIVGAAAVGGFETN
jgi:hypothetical protein